MKRDTEPQTNKRETQIRNQYDSETGCDLGTLRQNKLTAKSPE